MSETAELDAVATTVVLNVRVDEDKVSVAKLEEMSDENVEAASVVLSAARGTAMESKTAKVAKRMVAVKAISKAKW